MVKSYNGDGHGSKPELPDVSEAPDVTKLRSVAFSEVRSLIESVSYSISSASPARSFNVTPLCGLFAHLYIVSNMALLVYVRLGRATGRHGVKGIVGWCRKSCLDIMLFQICWM